MTDGNLCCLSEELKKAHAKIKCLKDDLVLLDGKLLARGERIAQLEKEVQELKNANIRNEG